MFPSPLYVSLCSQPVGSSLGDIQALREKRIAEIRTLLAEIAVQPSRDETESTPAPRRPATPREFTVA